jgi:hypothetical protein
MVTWRDYRYRLMRELGWGWMDDLDDEELDMDFGDAWLLREYLDYQIACGFEKEVLGFAEGR